MISNKESLGAALIYKFLTTPLSFMDYKELSCWLGCYGYSSTQERTFTEIDSTIHRYLIDRTSLDTEQIFLKLLFIRDLNHGYKTKATELFKPANST